MSTSDRLLDAAQSVLEIAGFSVQVEPLERSDRSWLLAENELFAVGAIAGDTLAELQPVETIASEALLNRLGGPGKGTKQGDIYLVMLTTQHWSAIDSRERVRLLYDTRGVRRLIGAELIPDEEGEILDAVAGALRPFLPLPDPLGGSLASLDEDLTAALVLNGVDSEAAPRFVAAYRAQGTLDDA